MIPRDLTRQLLLAAFCLLSAVGAMASPDCDEPKDKDRPRFSPEEFQKKETAYITAKAELTKAEATAFFPLFYKMKDQQRKLSFKNDKLMRSAWRKKLSNAESLRILEAIGENEEDILDLEEDYRKRFLKIVGASKLLKIKVAEKVFERDMLNWLAHGPRNRDNRRGAQGPPQTGK